MFIKKDVCRCCGSNKLNKYLDLGSQPMANQYHKNDIEINNMPLQLFYCAECFNSQIGIVVNPKEMFDNYLYVSGTTNTLQIYFENFVKSILSYTNNKENLTVLDIACNDGSLLEEFKKMGCEIEGVDPAKNLREITVKKNINVHTEYWSSSFAKKMNKKYDIITALNVFAHNDNATDFLNGCKEVMNNDSILVIEFPYNYKTITNNEFDQVYMEHLNYFLVNSFYKLSKKCKMPIIDVVESEIHGGSIRFILSIDENKKQTKKIEELINKEYSMGLFDEKTYKNYEDSINENIKNLKKYINFLETKNVKIVGYGASAKGNTFLNFSKINLDYIVDDNAMKHGYFTPGMNIPILNTSAITKEDELSIIVLSWNFYDEIKSKIKLLRNGKKTNIIKYVPIFSFEEV